MVLGQTFQARLLVAVDTLVLVRNLALHHQRVMCRISRRNSRPVQPGQVIVSPPSVFHQAVVLVGLQRAVLAMVVGV